MWNVCKTLSMEIVDKHAPLSETDLNNGEALSSRNSQTEKEFLKNFFF